MVNTKGKVQKSSKKYDVENKGIDAEVYVTINKNSKSVASVGDETAETLINNIKFVNNYSNTSDIMEDTKVSVPFIQLYDDNLYTYTKGTGSVTPTWTAKN